MKIKRAFAALLSLVMMLTMLPAPVKAADGETPDDSSGLITNKTATLTDDGTYTIDLEAYATGSVTTIPAKGTPLDIVLVIDQSGSMAYNDRGNSTSNASDRRMYKLQNAVRGFVNSISQNAEEYNADHRIAIAGYASNRNTGQSYDISGLGYNGNDHGWVNTGLYINGSFTNYGANRNNNNSSQLTTQNYKDALVSVNDANGNVAVSITTAINKFKASGGTYTEYGLRMAENVFQNNPASYTDSEGQQGTRKRIVVLFTDGETNSSISDVLDSSNRLKSTYAADVYCVGFGSDVDSDFLSYVSSNYLNSSYHHSFLGGEWYNGTYNGNKYSMTAKNSDELNEIFENISEDIQNPTADVELDANAVMKDVMGTGFTIPDNYNIEENVSIKTVNGSYSNGTYSFTTENLSPTGVTASIEENAIEVTGFDYSENFISEGHDGAKLVVQIRGILPTEEAVTNETVFTNDIVSGIYAADTPNIPAGTFPQPQTILTSKAYVLDYAKETALTELDQNGSVTAIVDTMKAVSVENNAVTGTYGNSNLTDGSISYAPKTTNWDGYDNIYVFGKTTNETIKAASANANGNLWSKISVIPANNVYYEDDFVTDTSSGTVGIEYTGNWETSTSGSTGGQNTETANGDIQGWETSLADDATYSDGSAHVSNTSGATATFTFTGTGVDIYSRTDMTTGTVLATLSGKDDAGTSVSKALIVDNYAQSYDDDSSGDADGYYQIPTLSFDGLAHGTYTVTIRVTTAAGSRSTYYLDGIRVYNPIKDMESDETVQDAYGEDELNASFTQVRDMLDNTSTVFIDEDADGNAYAGDYDESIYEQYGPKNEVYLASGQAVVFKVTDNGNYYVGLKAPAGETTASFSAGTNAAEITISHASDLYYKVVPDSNGSITIKNTGDHLLAITKLRTTGSGTVAMNFDTEEAVQAYNAFSLLDIVSYHSPSDAEDESTGNESEDPSGTVSEKPGDVEIDNPGDYTNDDSSELEEAVEETVSWIKNLLNGFKNLFSRW